MPTYVIQSHLVNNGLHRLTLPIIIVLKHALLLMQIVVPPLPGKAWGRQLPFRGDDGIFEDEFIEDRRKGLEQFVNK